MGNLQRLRFLAAAIVLILLLMSCTASTVRDGGEAQVRGPAGAILDFYRGPLDHLSAVRHGQCPMYPSCSEYTKKAMVKHGEATGWVMAMDRLLRCGRDEIKRVPKIRVNGSLKYYDPIEANDFWWTAN